jgi:hypothetical protein
MGSLPQRPDPRHTARQSKTPRTTLRFGLAGVWGRRATRGCARHGPMHQARACWSCTRSACERGPPGETSYRPLRHASGGCHPAGAVRLARGAPPRAGRGGSPAGRPTRQRSTPCRPQGDGMPATEPGPGRARMPQRLFEKSPWLPDKVSM